MWIYNLKMTGIWFHYIIFHSLIRGLNLNCRTHHHLEISHRDQGFHARDRASHGIWIFTIFNRCPNHGLPNVIPISPAPLRELLAYFAYLMQLVNSFCHQWFLSLVFKYRFTFGEGELLRFELRNSCLLAFCNFCNMK